MGTAQLLAWPMYPADAKNWGCRLANAVLGAGTQAHDVTGAVSATGHGERHIELRVTGWLADLMELVGLSLESVCRWLVDAAGPVSTLFNDSSMVWRATRRTEG